MSLLQKVQTGLTKGEGFDFPSPSDYRGLPHAGLEFFGDERFQYAKSFRFENWRSGIDAYRKCPPLSAILNKMAQAYINGKTWIMNAEGKNKGKESESSNAKKLKKLFKRPNPIQSWKQFEAQQNIYLDLFGFFLVLPIIPAGFEKYGALEATSLWNIPPTMLTIEETNKLFYQVDQSGMIKSIKLNYKGEVTELKDKGVYFFKDFIPSFETLVLPGNRIQVLEMPINNIIGALESRNVLINYRGALGAFTQEPNRGQFITRPLDEKEKERLQEDFRRYGLKKQQWKFIFSTASLKWQQIGVPTKDLMLFEEITDDTMRICDEYNFPSPLINTEKGPSVSNTDAYKKQLYEDAIIPKSEMLYEQWNQFFKTEDLGLDITKDYSHLPILQEDALHAAQARKERNEALLIEWQNDLITMNRWLELNGEDTRGTEGDVYYSEWKKAHPETQEGMLPGQQPGAEDPEAEEQEEQAA